MFVAKYTKSVENNCTTCKILSSSCFVKLPLSQVAAQMQKSRPAYAGLLEYVVRDYLWTLAPAPPMIASTSLLVAMVVSPGVVIASAPCAAP